MANLGDSRAIYSENKSQIIELLSQEHKPDSLNEEKRIHTAGGYIFK